MNTAIYLFLGSLSIGLCLTPWLKKLSHKYHFLDQPCTRKRHENPIPMLGGFAIFLSFALPVSLFLRDSPSIWIIISCASLCLGLGLIDDKWGSHPTLKLCGQFLIAVLTYLAGIQITWITNPLGGLFFLQDLSFPITVIWIVGMMNAINLIDGLDGLAAGISGISAMILAIMGFQTGQFEAALLAIALFGSCLSFLKFNFAPAQIFMGDSGAMVLGYLLSVISIIGVLKSTVTLSLLIPMLILGIPISDTVFSIFRRLKNKQAIFKADNGHFHHRLIDKGLSPKRIALLSYLTSLILGIFALFISQSRWMYTSILLVLVLISSFTGRFIIHKRRSRR